MNEAFFDVTSSLPVKPGEIVPSEIHYHPTGPDNAEFLELHNRSNHSVNLRGCFFSEGIEFAFPDQRDTLLAPGARIVRVDSQFGFQKRYGIDIPVTGVYRKNLSNSGETITLMAADGITQILSVSYQTAPPWPLETNGEGRSLILRNPQDLNNSASWRPSLALGGNPGASDSSTFTGNPDEDLNGDGITALAEYALGSDDLIPNDGRGLITLKMKANGHWEFTFPIALNADDLIATVQTSSDLETWAELAPDQATLTQTWIQGGRFYQTYTSTTSAKDDRFLIRVRYQKITKKFGSPPP